MAKEKQGMVFKYKWLRILNAMQPDEAITAINELVRCDQIGEYSRSVFDYDPVLQAVFESMCEEVLEARDAYVEKCEKNKANGSKGGRPKSNALEENPNKPNGFLEEPKKADYDCDCDIDCDKEIYSRVVRYLNDAAKTNYKTSSRKTRDLIKARLNEGYKYEDFVVVIDKKVNEWASDPKMSKFLRPETLFGSKFEGYLNQPITKPGSKNFTERNYSQTDYAAIEMAMT